MGKRYIQEVKYDINIKREIAISPNHDTARSDHIWTRQVWLSTWRLTMVTSCQHPKNKHSVQNEHHAVSTKTSKLANKTIKSYEAIYWGYKSSGQEVHFLTIRNQWSHCLLYKQDRTGFWSVTETQRRDVILLCLRCLWTSISGNDSSRLRFTRICRGGVWLQVLLCTQRRGKKWTLLCLGKTEDSDCFNPV